MSDVMRQEYKVLSDVEKAWMKEVKDIGTEFLQVSGCDRVEPRVIAGEDED